MCFPAVEQDHVGQRAEAALPFVRLVFRQAAGQHFPQTSGVIPCRRVFDVKATVIGFVRTAAHKHHHARHGIGAGGVGNVVALDTGGQGG